MNILEFLEARIAEDETAAREALSEQDTVYGAYGFWEPSRVLAECKAKRKLLTILEHAVEVFDGEYWIGPLQVMATPYADHPDYREEWRHD